MISYVKTRELNQSGNVIPIYRKIPADLDTPVSAYIKLASGKKNSFLLESIEGGEKLGRYSFVGFDPFLIVEGHRDKTILRQKNKSRQVDVSPDDFLKELFRVYKPVKVEGLPRFTGGGVGYFSYDTVRWIENIPDDNPDMIGLPETRFGLYRTIIVFDHLKQEIIIIDNILHEKGEPGLKKKYTDAVHRIGNLEKKLSSPLRIQPQPAPIRSRTTAMYTQEEYESMVRRAKRYIKEGDIFQVVLSQRWQIESKRNALTVYRNLRRINPSPYMFLLNYGDDAVIGASPEMMVRVEKNTIETRPIAGTRPRGKTEKEDEKLIADLMTDSKELAEHTMLLDLGRNDIGRVSKPGSVTVHDSLQIEKYSHVIHIVSSVRGHLKRRTSPLDGHFACFPAGTVSGAPKIRAMQIIDELEKLRRGVYAGSVAYLDFWGNLDSCIAIRTVVKRNNKYYVQAGAGIVADSKPAREFKETEAKAQALIQAITEGN